MTVPHCYRIPWITMTSANYLTDASSLHIGEQIETDLFAMLVFELLRQQFVNGGDICQSKEWHWNKSAYSFCKLFVIFVLIGSAEIQYFSIYTLWVMKQTSVNCRKCKWLSKCIDLCLFKIDDNCAVFIDVIVNQLEYALIHCRRFSK